MFGEISPKLPGINNTNSISNNGVNIANVNIGGTGTGSFANNNSIILTGATSTSSLTSITNDTSGKILTSNGVGVAPSMQPAPSGSYVLISSQPVSGVASVNFTGLSSTYFGYYLVFADLTPVTNATSLWLRTSTDGSTYDSGGTNYTYSYQNISSSASAWKAGSTGDSKIILRDTISNTADGSHKVQGDVLITGFATSGNNCLVHYRNTVCLSSGAAFSYQFGSGGRLSSTTVVAFQVLMSSGNISTGTFKLYGIVA